MYKNDPGFWDRKKIKLRKRYPLLEEKDLSYREGNEKEMIEMLGFKLGKSPQELLSIIVEI